MKDIIIDQKKDQIEITIDNKDNNIDVIINKNNYNISSDIDSTYKPIDILVNDQNANLSLLITFILFIRSLSGNWQSSFTTVKSNSADWDSTFTTVKSNSADWDSTFTKVQSNSLNWDSAFTSAQNNSLNSDSTFTTVKSNSANWDSAYDTIQSNSTNWDSAYDTIQSNSTNWDSAFTTVKSNSADWDYQGTDLKALSSNWQNTFTTFQSNSSIWSGGGINATFPTNLTVSLPGGRTFGRYATGEIIPAAGKTPLEVIQMAIAAPITPTASLNSSTTIAFNLTSISNVLTFSHTINTLGASVSSASLEWRRNNSGNWTVLSSSTISSGTFTHNLTSTSFNVQPFNYRYIVTDTAGANVTATRDITPSSYVAPSIVLNVVGASITSPESNDIRERGNVSSNISGSITRNSTNVPLTKYILQYQINNSGTWVDIGTDTLISGSSYTIPSTNHNPSPNNTISSISYRVKVDDAYTTTYSSVATVTFKYFIFYGSSASTPINSSQVRLLGNKIFVDGTNPFNLITGITNTKFTVAMPNTLSITLVEDLDAFNLNITTDYVNNPFSVNDAGGNSVSYKVYTKSQSVPYTDILPDGHRHRVTRA